MRIVVLLAMLLAAEAGAQTTINGSRRILGAWDASQATSTKVARQAAADPQSCVEGEVYYNTERHVHRQCTGPDTWTDWVGGGGVTPAGAANAIQYNAGAGLGGVGVNTTGTRRFLMQVSGGTPVFEALQAADIPSRNVAMYTSMAAAKCQSGLALANFNLPAQGAPTAMCQTGTTYGAVLRFAAGATQSFMEHLQLPADWSNTPHTIDLEFAGRSNDATHAVNIAVQYACVGTDSGIDDLNFQQAGTISFVPNADGKRTISTIANLAAAGCAANDAYYFKVAVQTDAAGAAYELVSLRVVLRRAF